jgi:hypothetical protein
MDFKRSYNNAEHEDMNIRASPNYRAGGLYHQRRAEFLYLTLRYTTRTAMVPK